VGNYIPILLEEAGGGKFKGSFPFDATFEVEGSRTQVVHRLYKAAAGCLQTKKCPRFLQETKDYRDSAYSYLKEDLFSAGEHLLLGFIAMVAGIIAFAIGFSALSYLWFYFSSVSSTPVTHEVYAALELTVRDLGWQKTLVFILLWNVFYVKIYPVFMRVYGSVLLLNSTLRTTHLIFITSLCTLFQSKPYDYPGGER